MIRTALSLIVVGLLALPACSKSEKKAEKDDPTVSAAKAPDDNAGADEDEATPSSADKEQAGDGDEAEEQGSGDDSEDTEDE